MLFTLIVSAFILFTPFVKATPAGITQIGCVNCASGTIFDYISGIAKDTDGNTYVSDGQHNQVLKFDNTGNKLATWGSKTVGPYGGSTYSSADGEFNSPSAVTVDGLGYVYVADSGNARIQKLNSSGELISTFGWGVLDGTDVYQKCTINCQIGISGGAGGKFNWPTAVTVDLSGNIYVVDNGNQRIQKFDSSENFLFTYGWGVQDGTAEFQICSINCQTGNYPQGPGGDGQFNYPNAITTDDHGKVFIPNNGKIEIFDSSGNFIESWGDVSGNAITHDSNNNIYVVDSNGSIVKKYDSSGNFISQFGSFGSDDGQLDYPRSIAIDNLNNIYIADSGNYRIEKFDSDLNFVSKFGTSVFNQSGTTEGKFSSPTGLMNTADGSLYVADTQNNRIQKLSNNGLFSNTFGEGVQDGAEEFQVCTSNCQTGPYGTAADGGFYTPTAISKNRSGGFYVLDSGNNRIEQFDSNQNFINTFGVGVTDGSSIMQSCISNCQAGSYGGGEGEFSNAQGMTTDNSGNIFVADSYNNRIQKFDSNGNFLLTWGSGVTNGNDVFQKCFSSCRSGLTGSGDGQFNYAAGVASDSDGNIYVVDQNNNRIQKFDNSGNYLSQWGSEGCYYDGAPPVNGDFCYPAALTIDANNNVYVADYNNSRIQKFNTNGQFLSQYAGNYDSYPLQNPSGISADGSGKVYVSINYTSIIILCDNDVSTNGCTGAEQSSSDSDSDNLPNSVEDAAPNAGDANNDGTLDSTQPNVTSLLNTITNTYSVLQTNCTTNTTTSISPESSDHKDTAYDYNVGLMNFTATGCGSTATITQYFYGNLDASNVTARKYNPTTNTYTTIDNATITNVTIGSQKALKITYTITDNGPLDLNPTTGTITDPSGPAVLTVGVPNTGL